MFHLESSIANWRRPMLAAGITAASLDELECHLREEFTRQSGTGLNEAEAFRAAVHKIGQPAPLSTEFQKSAGWTAWLGAAGTTSINRILGVVWLVYSVASLIKFVPKLWLAARAPGFEPTTLFFIALLMDLIYFLGVIASLWLFAGATRARRFILFLAALDAVGGVCFLASHSFQPLCAFYTIAGFITVWLLWPTSKSKLAAG